MLSHSELIDAGYRHWPREHPRQWLNSATDLYQKRVRGPEGTRYFLNVFHFKHADYEGWQPEVQFEHPSGTFNVTMLGAPDVAAVESFFGTLYERMGCEPYERDEVQP